MKILDNYKVQNLNTVIKYLNENWKIKSAQRTRGFPKALDKLEKEQILTCKKKLILKSQCTGQTESHRAENNISKLKERAKEIIRMWFKEIKRIKNRIEKLGDMENAMQRSILRLIECPDDIIGRIGEQQY